MTVKLLDVEISGSPFNAIIYPGEVKSSLCTSTVDADEITELRAGITYFFTITFFDIYGNEHYQTMTDDMLDVAILAEYEDHDAWPSPILIADASDWQANYGSNIAGIAIDNNNGKMTG